MKIIIELLGVVFSGVLSVILANLHIPLHISILYGVILLISWISTCIIYNQSLKTKEFKDTISSKDSKIKELDSQIEELKKKLLSSNSCLKHRSSEAVTNFIKEAKTNFYISGINNSGAISIILNNKDIIKECYNKNVKIHILFCMSDNEQNFEWYLKMLCGGNATNKRFKLEKDYYHSGLNIIEQYEIFKNLIKHNLLEVRCLDIPATTAFIASDIQRDVLNGQIQCQFYQYNIDSPESPVCQLIPSDEMFPTMRDVILDMWKDASQILDIDYTGNITIRADEHE